MNVIIFAVLGYFALWIYIFFLIMKFKKCLFKNFPNELELILDKERFFGIPVNPFLLWDDDIKNLAKRNKETKDLRRISIKFFYFGIIAMFALIPLLFIIVVLFLNV